MVAFTTGRLSIARRRVVVLRGAFSQAPTPSHQRPAPVHGPAEGGAERGRDEKAEREGAGSDTAPPAELVEDRPEQPREGGAHVDADGHGDEGGKRLASAATAGPMMPILAIRGRRFNYRRGNGRGAGRPATRRVGRAPSTLGRVRRSVGRPTPNNKPWDTV